MSTFHNPANVAQLLLQLLSDNYPHPELGTRLKQRLKAAYAERGYGIFDEKTLGFRRFVEYLEKEHGDLVLVERPNQSSDILVSLKTLELRRTTVPEPSDSSQNRTSQTIRTAVWQAFANPDSQRKRFLSPDGRVVHYLEGASSEAQQMVEASSDQYVPIPPITQDTQSGWMREFLGGLSLNPVERALLEQMVAEPYSSTLNATFTRALGNHGSAWSRFRTERVITIILRWADENSVDRDLLYIRPIASQSTDSLLPESAAASTSGSISSAPSHVQNFSPRERVIKLLDLLSDDDLERLVLPTLLSTILIKSRM